MNVFSGSYRLQLSLGLFSFHSLKRYGQIELFAGQQRYYASHRGVLCLEFYFVSFRKTNIKPLTYLFRQAAYGENSGAVRNCLVADFPGCSVDVKSLYKALDIAFLEQSDEVLSYWCHLKFFLANAFIFFFKRF